MIERGEERFFNILRKIGILWRFHYKPEKKRLRRREMRVKSVVVVVGFLAVLMLFAGIRVASAEVEIGELGKVFDKFLIGGEINAFYRYDTAPYYGAHVARAKDKDTHFGESFARVSFTAIKDLGWTNLTGSAAFNWMSTVDQDFYGIYKDRSEVDLDWAYVKLGSLFKSPFDLTVGPQNIQIEKSMVIGQGTFQKAAAWLLFQFSFPMAVRLDGNFGPLSTTAFWARSDNYYQEWVSDPANDTFGRDDVEVAGINLHYNFTNKVYAYGGFYQKIDNGDLMLDNLRVNNDTQAFDVGLDITTNRFAGGIINLE
jgi:hypothetical protein